MSRLMSVFAVLALACSAALAAGPAEVNVQGFYEGTRTDAAGTSHRIEARVVAQGKAEYIVLTRETGEDGKVVKHTLNGKTDGDKVTFTGQGDTGEWKASYDDGKVTGTCGKGCKLDLKRMVRLSPTMGAKCPAGGIILLDGKNFDEVEVKPGKDGKTPKWIVDKDGGVLVAPKGIYSKRTFSGSLTLHVEFKCPLRPGARSQGRGNSGCFMPNGNEVQVLDSFGMTTYKGGGCGGLYKFKDPDAFDEFSLASAPPEQWQTYDITYIVPTKDGKPTGRPKITVFHNGIEIHDKAQLNRATKPGKLMFQDHGNPVKYRNVWVVEKK